VKHPVYLVGGDSSSKTRQNDSSSVLVNCRINYRTFINVFLLPAGRFNALRQGDKHDYAIALKFFPGALLR